MTPREQKLAVVLGIVGVFAIMSATEKGQQVVAKVADSVGASVRGIRNNNPGNIRLSGDKWQGMRAEQTDGAFVQFVEMKYGVRAAAKVFRNYGTRYGLHTISGLVSRWAPPVENDTGAYVASVCKRVGVGPDALLNLYDPETLYKFLRAIFRHECGAVAELIPESTIREGIALA